jgi:hypothetical protein
MYSIEIDSESHRSKADYVLMLVQCLLGVVVMFLPDILARKLKFQMPSCIYMAYIIFLYCAIFLGEVGNFYYTVPHWDTILHTFSGIMSGAFGFYVVSMLNKDKHIRMNLPPLFVALSAFCFAVTLGALWEIYEFVFDGALSLNMQKYVLEDGTQLIGRNAIHDTMKDLIVDCLGAFVVSAAGYISIKNKKGWFQNALSTSAYADKGKNETETNIIHL